MMKSLVVLAALIGTCQAHAVDLCGEGAANGSLPEWVCDSVQSEPFKERYVARPNLEPPFLVADFDADSSDEVVVWATERHSGAVVLVLFKVGHGCIVVLGADSSSGYSSFDKWRIIPAGTVLSSHWEDRELELVGDALVLEKSESASVAVFWDGQNYRFYALTD